MMNQILLVIFSFCAAFCLSVVMGMEKKYLFFGGLGSALTRIVYLLLIQCMSESFLYCFLAAAVAAFYAEFMAVHTRRPSTIFLYPSIIPLIPGELLHYTALGLLMKDGALFISNTVQLLHSLLGLGLGFTVISIVMHYKNNYLHLKQLDAMGRRLARGIKRTSKEKLHHKQTIE